MQITRICYIVRHVSAMYSAVELVPPFVFVGQQDSQNLSENSSKEQKSSTNSHSLDIEWSFFLGEKPRAGNRASLTYHTKYDQPCTSFGGRALIVSHPSEGESHGWEDATANQVGSKISHSTCFHEGLNQVSDSTHCTKCTQEIGAIFDLIGKK